MIAIIMDDIKGSDRTIVTGDRVWVRQLGTACFGTVLEVKNGRYCVRLHSGPSVHWLPFTLFHYCPPSDVLRERMAAVRELWTATDRLSRSGRPVGVDSRYTIPEVPTPPWMEEEE
jgi:hypothetical protein